MNGLRSGLVTLVVSGALGVFTVIGCSAEGSSGVIDGTFEAEPEAPGATLPPSTSGGVTGPTDAGKKEGGAKDGGNKDGGPPDAGPPPPTPGTPCTVLNEIRTRPCGACGTQEAVCQAADSKWSEYSTQCVGETPGGCIPGTTVSCGKCGVQTCSQFCALLGSCKNEPANACVPGGIELTNASCPPDLYKQRSCNSTCSAPNFSDACLPPPNVVEVPPTTDSVNWTIAILSENQTLPRISGTSCPTATFTTILTPYVYVRVHNPLATPATVAIYNSVAPGGVPFKTALAAYAGDTGPTDEASRKACLKANSYGTQALTGDSNFASLDGVSRQVTIPAGASVSVLVEAYNAFDATKPTLSTGKVKLNVMTVSLN